MKKDLTELVFILDRSGSMGGLEDDTIGGFNAMLEKQKREEGRVLVTTVLFDNGYDMIHDRLPLEKVPPMDRETYYVRGCTALLDAVGRTVHHISTIHKYAREEDRPERTIFVITTDGMENASKQFTYPKVKKLIGQQKALDWEFLFLGANIDAAGEAARFGIDADKAANYHADSVGTQVLYCAVSDAIGQARRSSAPLSAGWKKQVVEDFENRKGG